MFTYPPEWSYYFSIEVDFIESSRYVEICEDNFNTYSTQFVRLLLAAGSEVDVIAKEVCKDIDPANSPSNIDGYRSILVRERPAIPRLKFGIQWNPLRLQPWESWGNGANPDWWHAYNAVKHGRTENFKSANLRNAINALSGLYALMLHLDRPRGIERPTRYLRIESQ